MGVPAVGLAGGWGVPMPNDGGAAAGGGGFSGAGVNTVAGTGSVSLSAEALFAAAASNPSLYAPTGGAALDGQQAQWGAMGGAAGGYIAPFPNQFQGFGGNGLANPSMAGFGLANPSYGGPPGGAFGAGGLTGFATGGGEAPASASGFDAQLGSAAASNPTTGYFDGNLAAFPTAASTGFNSNNNNAFNAGAGFGFAAPNPAGGGFFDTFGAAAVDGDGGNAGAGNTGANQGFDAYYAANDAPPGFNGALPPGPAGGDFDPNKYVPPHRR